jgi:hypothetical protein
MEPPFDIDQTKADSTGAPPSWAEVAPLLDAHFGGSARIIAPRNAGAYSPASRWIVAFGDGRRAFVKSDRNDRACVANDARACLLELGPFMPRVLA